MTLSSSRILLFLLLTTPGLAQQILTGTVQTGDGQSVAFANVLLVHLPDSTLVKGAVADPAGSYTFAYLRPGRYRVMASLMGYQPTYSTPFVLTDAGGTRRAEPLVLLTMTNQLDEVRVSTKKPPFEQQIDKLVVNVASMITAGGGSALDVLERSPGVLVDRQNGSIALGGRDGVMVMINGKLSRLLLATVVQLLGGMNADNIEKIELMANPSAKYDAEGNAGLINIVLKRNTDEGTNGSLSLMGGYGRYEKANGSVSLNHNRERINWFANGSWNYDNRWFDFEAIRTQPVACDLWRNYQYSDRYMKNTNVDLRLGADLLLSKQTTLSMQVQGLVNNRRATSYNTSNTRLTTQNQPFTQSVLTWLEETPWQNVSGSVGLLHRFGNGQTISIDADYQYYTNRASNRLFVDQLITTQPTTTPLQSVNTSK
ncbi:MAG: carboxypeptidase regulatory-like domain-containing protein, partial [Gemmataceae bacterium]